MNTGLRASVLTILGVGFVGCRDGGEVHYQDALRLQARAMEKHEPASSPSFDAVIAELDKVPADSKRAEAAQKLKAAIVAVRNPVRRPLAMAYSEKDEATLPPAVVEQARACARLATIVGADGGATHAGLVALDECRKKVEALREAAEHADEPK